MFGCGVSIAVAAFVASFGISVARAENGVLPAEEYQQLFADIVSRQQRQIDQQNRALREQQERIEALEGILNRQAFGSIPYSVPRVSTAAYHENPGDDQSPQGGSVPIVGEDDSDQDEVLREGRFTGLTEQAGGILTRPGTLIFEPKIEFSQSGSNRFFFQGLEVAGTVLVGAIEATDSDRDLVVGTGSFRYGLTDSAEVEVEVPFVYGMDRVTRTIVSAGGTTVSRTIDNATIGDVSISGRYQFNRAGTEWPVFVGIGRFKTDTGEGPFDVGRDAAGVETSLPTGSGFYGVEGGVTALYPTDPVVFFGQATYLHQFQRSVDRMIGGSFVSRVDPGGVLGISFGMGFGVNERTSFSIGYKHNFVFPTITEIDGIEVESESFDVGSLLLGFTYVPNDRMALNLNLEAGITDDAPDIRLIFRVPIRFSLFN